LPSPVTNAEKLAKQLKAAEDTVKCGFSECPSHEKLVDALLDVGLDRLSEKCHLTAGLPVFPMLAKPTKGITEILDRFSGIKFTCEFKYDGERAQIHKLSDGTVKIFR
jgi:DNA ligase-1